MRVVWLLLFLSLLTGCSSRDKQAREAPSLNLACTDCNVVLLNIGLLRADRVGLIDPAQGTTPNIDRFFATGAVFEQAMAPSGATYLSATSVATGTEALFNGHRIQFQDLGEPPARTGSAGNQGAGGGRWAILSMLEREGRLVVDHMPTIAQALRRHGYHTVGINDWIHTGADVHLDRGFGDFTELTDPNARAAGDFTSQVSIEEQVALVRNKLQTSQQPVFLYFHPNTLHFPFPHPDKPKEKVYRDADPSLFVRAYEHKLRQIDAALGSLFKLLTETPSLRRTVVFLYSNHGCALGENQHVGVGLAYQNNVHSPLLMRHPAITEQQRVRVPVSLVDLASTIYEMLGVASPAPALSHSMLPLAAGTGPYTRSRLFGQDLHQEYVRDGAWKLVAKASGEQQLFHLQDDPAETTNLVTSHRDRAAALKLALDREKLRQLRAADEWAQKLGLTEDAVQGVGTPLKEFRGPGAR